MKLELEERPGYLGWMQSRGDLRQQMDRIDGSLLDLSSNRAPL